MNLEDIQKELDSIMIEQNSRMIPKFEGYSPSDMHHILYFTFGKDSPIKLNQLNDSDYQSIPIFNLIRYLLQLIDQVGEIKLTKLGYLPTKVVSEIYHQGFLTERRFEIGFSKLYKETDSLSVNLTRNLCTLSGFTKKRNGKLSLTQAGKKALENSNL